MQLFYSQDLSPTDAKFSFSKEESRHIAKVLRKQIGDTLHLTNGKGDLFSATLQRGDPKCCVVAITNVEQKKATILRPAPSNFSNKTQRSV